MKPKIIPENTAFVGRQDEFKQLASIASRHEASIIVTYGRRRVGKTELLEQAFRHRNILKFEGIEGQPESAQKLNVLAELAHYCEDPYIAKLQLESWKEIFSLIAKHINQQKITLYFEEVQWLANYRTDFIAELKYVWDNQFRYNENLILILCGSSPSFMISKVIKSKALYNRSQWELPIDPLSFTEAKALLPNHDIRSLMDAYLTVGGIPEYLKRLQQASSVFLSLCQQSFIKGGFFSTEYQRIFISSLAENKHYKTIIEFLSDRKFATRNEILKHLNVTSNGDITELLTDLVACGFIGQYTPFNATQTSRLIRYQVTDSYLQFYFKFIKPIENRINNKDFQENPSSAIKLDTYYKWLGFAFERFCCRYHVLIAKQLGFSGVHYNVGPFFNRDTDKKQAGFQIDLIFERDDRVYTICEIKYLQSKVDSSVIEEVERKLVLFPNKKKYTIQRVLISAFGAEQSLIDRAYFDNIITLEDLLGK